MPKTALFSLLLLILSAQFSELYAERNTLDQQAYEGSANFMHVRQKLSSERIIGLGGMCEQGNIPNVAEIFQP